LQVGASWQAARVSPPLPPLALSAAAATETDVVAVDLVESSGTLIVLDLDPAPVLGDARPVVQALFHDVAPALTRIA
jgi:glutathione synthase/RimK-type ligase-like ATP-grasp enzyme